MPRHARLRQAEDQGELGDVQPLAAEDTEEPEPGLVAEEPIERRQALHHASVNLHPMIQRGKCALGLGRRCGSTFSTSSTSSTPAPSSIFKNLQDPYELHNLKDRQALIVAVRVGTMA